MNEINSQQTPPAKQSIVGPLFTGIAIGGIIFGGGYYVWNSLNSNTKVSDAGTITTPTTTNIVTPAPAVSSPVTSTSTTPATTTPTSIAYSNSQYGFSMTLPATWENYKIKTATFDGEVATLYFEMPTTDSSPVSSTNDKGYYSPFAIGIYTPAQWATIQNEGGPSDTLIKQTSKYVFAWSHANGIPPTDWTKDGDISSIIASFKTN
jgi:hypothetical protein